MGRKLSDKNPDPTVSANIAGIGVLSPHGKKLNQIAKNELKELLNRISCYTFSEQLYIIDSMSSLCAGEYLDRAR